MGQAMKRVEMTVDSRHMAHIRSCLAERAACSDVSISPVIAGWGPRGYWSSEGVEAFSRIGEKVMIRFTASSALLDPLLRTGFGILAMELIPISETHLAA